jgi:glucose/arabinose dehydrogenase/lysophospholipase L1-like esterase
MCLRRCVSLACWLLLSCGFLPSSIGPGSSRLSAAELVVKSGDSICLIGNALGERLQHHNSWEALLMQRFPKHQLRVRNLCFPGDEPALRLRSENFGEPDVHLRHSRADVILCFFGFNEAFAGPEGVSKFEADLAATVRHMQGQDYSGQGAPRIALVSPIAFENTGDPNLPDGAEHNPRLALYTAAIARVAEQTGATFVDVFNPTLALFAQSQERLTLNGAHLNAAGYAAFAPLLDRALFGNHSAGNADAAPVAKPELVAALDDKNFHWWHRYRAVNGYSIYGKRGEAGSDGTYRNREVMEREREILDQMTANRDERIWALAQGERPAAPVDDSNTLPFIEPKTNVGGGNDPNAKAGKLGSLDYLSAEEQRQRFKLPAGYEVTLVASEEMFPELANPVAINFDNRGRLWVATMPSYPQWKPKTQLNDKLLILEDDDGDGRAERCKVFADGLHQPTGFEIGRGGVYVSEQPDILFLEDTDGDDVADRRVRKLFGFDSADSHHGLAAFEWGPDGALYFQEGTFKQSAVETPYGVERLSDAGVWRYDPRTERLEVHVSVAFANPWGHVFDAWGQNFVCDASPGFNYLAAPISGSVTWPDKHPGGALAGGLDNPGSKIQREPPHFIVKRTRPSSGCEIVSSRHFPPEAQGNFLINNVIGDRSVLQHTLEELNSGFLGKEITPLLYCEDGNFRPVDLQFGPDGALYVCDWHNALIGHLQHNLREPHRDRSHGRIWRITYPGRPLLQPPAVVGEAVPRLLELLREPEDRTRYRVRRELAQRDTTEVLAATQHWLERLAADDAETPRLKLEALWIHQTHNVIHEPLLRELLQCAEPRARAAATRVLAYWRDSVAEVERLVHERLQDEHPRVRMEAVRAASFLDPESMQEAVLDVLEQPMDENLEYVLDETVRHLEAKAGK